MKHWAGSAVVCVAAVAVLFASGRATAAANKKTTAIEGKTVFLCSHLLKEMEPLCDTVAILNDGVVCRTGTMDELLTGEDSHYLARFRGLNESSLLQLQSLAVSVEQEEDTYVGSFRDQNSAVAAAEALSTGGVELLELHPHRLSLEEVFIEAVGGIPQ